MKKKLLSILLSVFMVFGCFVNVAHADTLTVGDLLNKAAQTFPTNPENGWESEEGYTEGYLYVNDNYLSISFSEGEMPLISLSDEILYEESIGFFAFAAAPNLMNGCPISFIVENDCLKMIYIADTPFYPLPLNATELIVNNEDFPIASNDVYLDENEYWINDNGDGAVLFAFDYGYNEFIDDDEMILNFVFDNNIVFVNEPICYFKLNGLNECNVEIDDGTYSTTNALLKFNVDESNNLVSIYAEFEDKYSQLTGTYVPQKRYNTVGEIIDSLNGKFPSTLEKAWQLQNEDYEFSDEECVYFDGENLNYCVEGISEPLAIASLDTEIEFEDYYYYTEIMPDIYLLFFVDDYDILNGILLDNGSEEHYFCGINVDYVLRGYFPIADDEKYCEKVDDENSVLYIINPVFNYLYFHFDNGDIHCEASDEIYTYFLQKESNTKYTGKSKISVDGELTDEEITLTFILGKNGRVENIEAEFTGDFAELSGTYEIPLVIPDMLPEDFPSISSEINYPASGAWANSNGAYLFDADYEGDGCLRFVYNNKSIELNLCDFYYYVTKESDTLYTTTCYIYDYMVEETEDTVTFNFNFEDDELISIDAHFDGSNGYEDIFGGTYTVPRSIYYVYDTLGPSACFKNENDWWMAYCDNKEYPDNIGLEELTSTSYYPIVDVYKLLDSSYKCTVVHEYEINESEINKDEITLTFNLNNDGILESIDVEGFTDDTTKNGRYIIPFTVASLAVGALPTSYNDLSSPISIPISRWINSDNGASASIVDIYSNNLLLFDYNDEIGVISYDCINRVLLTEDGSNEYTYSAEIIDASTFEPAGETMSLVFKTNDKGELISIDATFTGDFSELNGTYMPYQFINDSISAKQGTTDEIEFITNAKYIDQATTPVTVKVDGNSLTYNVDYTVSSGSTHVVLKGDYVKTLAVGTHTITIKESGYDNIDTNFTISGSSPTPTSGYNFPKTGIEVEPTSNHSLLKLSSLSLLAIGTYIVIKKKKDK